MGTITYDSVDIFRHARHTSHDTWSCAMSEPHVYRIKARCMVDLYQYVTADDVDRAIELALDAHNEWQVETLDDAEVKRVLQIERIN